MPQGLFESGFSPSVDSFRLVVQGVLPSGHSFA